MAKDDRFIKVYEQGGILNDSIQVLVDKKTGVNYTRLFRVVRSRELRSVVRSFVILRCSFLTSRFPTLTLSSVQP